MRRGEADGQRVARHRRHEHRGGDRIDLDRCQGEIRPEALAGFLGCRLGSVDRGERRDNRVDHAAGACGVGRRRRGQHEVGERHAVGQPQGRSTQRRDEEQRDAASQARDEEPVGNEEGGDDEPNRGVAESLERFLLGGHGAGHHGRGETDHGHGGGGQGLEDQPQDRADEDSGHVHAARVDALGGWDAIDGDRDDEDQGDLDRHGCPAPRRAGGLAGSGGLTLHDDSLHRCIPWFTYGEIGPSMRWDSSTLRPSGPSRRPEKGKLRVPLDTSGCRPAPGSSGGCDKLDTCLFIGPAFAGISPRSAALRR